MKGGHDSEFVLTIVIVVTVFFAVVMGNTGRFVNDKYSVRFVQNGNTNVVVVVIDDVVDGRRGSPIVIDWLLFQR